MQEFMTLVPLPLPTIKDSAEPFAGYRLAAKPHLEVVVSQAVIGLVYVQTRQQAAGAAHHLKHTFHVDRIHVLVSPGGRSDPFRIPLVAR
jgi:hypothetical protein